MRKERIGNEDVLVGEPEIAGTQIDRPSFPACRNQDALVSMQEQRESPTYSSATSPISMIASSSTSFSCA
jgi:hypothetical protein